jgi:2,5-furandicarboxylate decarboxylase 1
MAYRDFRQFLDALRAHGELVDVHRPVSLQEEIGRALKQAYVRQGPAFVFANNGTEFPLVAGLYSTRSKALLAFEATEETVYEKVLHGLDHPIPPVGWSGGTAPCQEIVLTGDDLDVTRFPIPTYAAIDGGPYLTPGLVISKDPETGVPDLGHYRFLLVDRTTLAPFAQPFHRFGKHLAKAERLGVAAEGALVIGVDPVLAYTGPIQVPDDTNDWHVAGGLRGEPVELVRCKTVDLEVPATAEVVIEFRMDFGHTVLEGPLGEYTGYFTPPSQKPVARITAITHRRQPYFQGLLTGKPVTENHILKQIPFEASLYRSLRRQFPTVERVAVPPSGGVQFNVVIAIRPRFAGEARQAILAAMASNVRPKWIVAVDPDVDVFNSAEVEWALAFHVQPARDVFVVEQMPAGPLDPTVGEQGALAARLSSAVGIDATRPFGEPFPEVADVVGWREYDFPELRGAGASPNGHGDREAPTPRRARSD